MCKSLVAPAPDGGFNLTSTFLRWAAGQAPGAKSSPPTVVVSGHPWPDP